MSMRSDLADLLKNNVPSQGMSLGGYSTLGFIVADNLDTILAALRDAPSTEIEGEPGRDPSRDAGWSAAPEPQSVSALPGDHPSREQSITGHPFDYWTMEAAENLVAVGLHCDGSCKLDDDDDSCPCRDTGLAVLRLGYAAARVSDEHPSGEDAQAAEGRNPASAVGAAETPLHPDPDPRSDPETAAGAMRKDKP